MAPTWDDPHEESLLAELRGAIAIFDPVPPTVRSAAIAAFAFRSVEAELAQLVFDSQVDGLVGVRGDVGRQLTFRGAAHSIELEVLGSVHMRLIGQLVPPAACLVEILQNSGTTVAVADSLGRFACAGLSPGRMTVRCTDGDGDLVVQSVSTVI